MSHGGHSLASSVGSAGALGVATFIAVAIFAMPLAILYLLFREMATPPKRVR